MMDDPCEEPIADVDVLPQRGCWCGLGRLLYVRTHFTCVQETPDYVAFRSG